MSLIQEAMTTVMKKAIAAAPNEWMPGGVPDPMLERRDGLVGTSVSRRDGPKKVSGSAPFAAEIAVDNMLYAALVYSTVAKGRIVSIKTADAKAAPGVVLVMTWENAPRLKPTPAFLRAMKGAAGDDLPVMQDAEVHWNGEPIAVVLAETQEQADHAKALIQAAYRLEDAVTDYATAKAHKHEAPPFQGESLQQSIGDAEQALAGAPFQVDATYTTPRYNHNAIELHAVTVAWADGELHLHDATQCVDHTAWSLAKAFGLKEEQVHVTSPFVGGGFGGKTLWQHHVLACAASKLAGRPVRMVLSREGVYRIVGGRTTTDQRVALGAQADGRFDALIQTGVVAMTAHNNVPEPFIMPAKCLYKSESFLFGIDVAEMNMVANTFMRAPGEAVGTFALESAIDELAEALVMDPIELRRRNEPETDPTMKIPFSSRHLVECYETGAARFGWDKRQKPRTRREGEWFVGMGVATGTYPYYRIPGGAVKLTLRADGTVLVEASTHEMGMGTATTTAVVVADRLGLTLDQVEVAYGDNRMPGVILAGGSQQTASLGAALIAAHTKLLNELLKHVGNDSPLAGLKTGEVGSANGGLQSHEDPSRFESYASLLARMGKEELAVEGAAPPPLEYQHWSMHSYSAIFSQVRVSAVTGELKIDRLLGSFDCGRIINAKTAASQFRGGMIMGIGMALMEEAHFDERKGRIMNPSLSDYHVPVHMDVPQIDIIWTDIPDPRAPMGARGVGEIGITGTAASIANAVFNATGKRVRDLPITLDKTL